MCTFVVKDKDETFVCRICFLQIFAYAGINYSSPTLATAMGNLIPGLTFLLAVTFRLDHRSINIYIMLLTRT